jgi:hypothetical protein
MKAIQAASHGGYDALRFAGMVAWHEVAGRS